ncbi:MAG: glutathione binding-like protein [Pseudomonadota bacterium]
MHPAFEPIARVRNAKPPLPAALTRTGMTIYVYPNDLVSHWVRFVVAEKDMDGMHIEWVKPGQTLEDLTVLDPAHRVPLLAEREVILNAPRIIVEYLDERYPHPPMMPVEPSARAKLRLALHRIEQDLFPLVSAIQSGPMREAQKARKQLLDNILAGTPIFGAKNYFLSSDFSMVDALWATLLWRLPSLGIPLPAHAKIIQRYADRLFGRPAFGQSLTPAERALR